MWNIIKVNAGISSEDMGYIVVVGFVLFLAIGAIVAAIYVSSGI